MKWFREDIGMFIGANHVNEFDKPTLDLIKYSVAINLDVFRALMEHMVSSNVDGRLVVTKQLCSVLNLDLQISK